MINIKKDLPNSVLLTFSKKNFDVADILEEVGNHGTKKTDYICEAIRFYYKNKNRFLNAAPLFNEQELDKRVQHLVYKYLSEYQKKFENQAKFDISEINKSDLEDD